jgi:putative transposase
MLDPMELFHVMNRGVDKRIIYEDDQDRARFVHDMFEFNDTRRAVNSGRRAPGPTSDVARRSSGKQMLVDIHAWCLMNNHYHLLLSEKEDRGLSTFLKKLNGGYAKYFNEKYARAGALFQGRTKRVLVESEAHFLHIIHYLHFNPLDYVRGAEHWREGRISSARKALEYLDSYKWSSFLDYCGKKNFPSVLSHNLFQDVYKDYQASARAYVREIELSPLRNYFLE